MKEFISLLFLRLKVSIQNLIEYIKVITRYYRYPIFRKNDLALLKKYLCHSPFQISKKFCQKRKDTEIYVYGETPLTLIHEMIRQAEVSSRDTFIDLGAGRGRICFWVNGVIGCPVIGIEEIPEFVAIAKQIAQRQTGLEFRCEEMTKSDLEEGSVFYLYGNFLSEAKLKKLAKKLDRLKKGTKVISISFPFNDYSKKYALSKSFQVRFPWGVTEAYLCLKGS